MGRAVLIICTGVLVTLGYVGLGALQQGREVAVSNISYVDRLRAKNAAQTAIQMAMAEINNDDTWKDDKTKESPWINNIGNSEVQLYVETIYEETAPDKFFEPDTIKVISTASYRDSKSEELSSTRVMAVYVTSAIGEFIQPFNGAIAVTAENINISSDGSGTATISGIDMTGQCVDKPALSTSNEPLISKVEENTPPFEIEGELKWISDLDFTSTKELVNRLETQEEVTFIRNDYYGDLGTETDPGVFFVDNSATIHEDVEQGYGILIIRKGGNLALEDSAGNSIPVGENLTFNGLGIFEDAYEFDVQKVPSFNGTLLFEETEHKLKNLEVKLTGNIRIQYDCTAENYAKQAAAELLPFKRYRRISTFE